MTRTIEIYGASDDLIEVEGDISEEFNPDLDGDAPNILAFSDGTLLEVSYTSEGLWKITRTAKGSAQYSTLFEATDPDGEYSDKVQMRGDIRWVALASGGQIARARS